MCFDFQIVECNLWLQIRCLGVCPFSIPNLYLRIGSMHMDYKFPP